MRAMIEPILSESDEWPPTCYKVLPKWSHQPRRRIVSVKDLIKAGADADWSPLYVAIVAYQSFN